MPVLSHGQKLSLTYELFTADDGDVWRLHVWVFWETGVCMHRGVSEKISGVTGERQRIFKPCLCTLQHREGGNTACVDLCVTLALQWHDTGGRVIVKVSTSQSVWHDSSFFFYPAYCKARFTTAPLMVFFSFRQCSTTTSNNVSLAQPTLMCGQHREKPERAADRSFCRGWRWLADTSTDI